MLTTKPTKKISHCNYISSNYISYIKEKINKTNKPIYINHLKFITNE